MLNTERKKERVRDLLIMQDKEIPKLHDFEKNLNKQLINMGMIQRGGAPLRIFKSPDIRYRKYRSIKRPFSPSPKRRDFEKVALTKPDNHSMCTFIIPETGKRCKLQLGIYPRFCHLHTQLIYNVHVAKSGIKKGGNGLYVGLYGFKKGMIIGEYSEDKIKVNGDAFRKRNGKDRYNEYKDVNDMYLLCANTKKNEKEICWDALDIRSTIIRNANDAHNSNFRNNAYFDQKRNRNGKIHVYMVASRNIAAGKEILCSYGDNDSYWK